MYRKDTDRAKKHSSSSKPNNQPHSQPHKESDKTNDLENDLKVNENNLKVNDNDEPVIISPGEVKVQPALHLETIEKSETVVTQSKPVDSFVRADSKRKNIIDSKSRKSKHSTSSEKSTMDKKPSETVKTGTTTKTERYSDDLKQPYSTSVYNKNQSEARNLNPEVVTSTVTSSMIDSSPNIDSALLLDLSEIKAADDSTGDLIGRNEIEDSEIDGHLLVETESQSKSSCRERQNASTPREVLTEKGKDYFFFGKKEKRYGNLISSSQQIRNGTNATS